MNIESGDIAQLQVEDDQIGAFDPYADQCAQAGLGRRHGVPGVAQELGVGLQNIDIVINQMDAERYITQVIKIVFQVLYT